MRGMLIVFAVLIVASPAVSQQPDYVTVDRIVAVVGRSVITRTRLEEEINVYRQQGGQLPTDSAALGQFYLDILDRMIDEELLIQAAERDTMAQVIEQDLQAAVEPVLRQVRSQFASELEYESNLRSAGFVSPNDYRRWMTEQKRRELLREQYLQLIQQRGEMTPLPPTERELREFFESTRAERPQRPATMSFRQIVVRARPDTTELRRAFKLADSLAVAIRRGEDFNVLARRFSADTGSREQGGELGWVRRGQNLVREFEEVAFKIRPGAISPPVLTAYGFHIIEVLRAQPAEVSVRHILISPTISEIQKAEALQTALEMRDALQAGASFDSLARMYHDDLEQRVIQDASVQDLPPIYATELQLASPNTIIGPIDLDRGDGRPKYAVVAFDEMRSGGEFTFEDVRDVMRGSLAQQNGLNKFLEVLRKATYIDVRF